MEIDFKFKGTRTYVHGTDMIHEFLNRVEDVEFLNIRILKITDQNLRLITESFSDNSPIASIKIKNKNGDLLNYHYISSGNDAKGRYAYNEESVVDNSSIESSELQIIMNYNTKYTWVENVVALHKFMLNKKISNEVKWLFVGLEINNLPKMNALTSDSVLKLNVSKKLGYKLIQSDIKIDDVVIGNIKFSSLPK